MNRKPYFLLGIFLTAGLVVILVYGLFYASRPGEIPSAQISQAAKPFQTTTFDGRPISLKQFKGQPIILNFWASWCLPCRREMASLEQLHRLTGESNIKVITVNLGEAKDTVIDFVDSIEPAPTFPVLLDANSSSAASWNVKGLPTTYILSEQGRIVFKALGGRDFEHPDMIQKIRQLSSVN